ncbi:MAG: NAD(P)/FAD-dependent oxidoreductase [Clostridiales bacterium]|nr:NAD(P)/FAD-dependent oxidoreductase [Clostridiales bacterium]
MSKIIVIGGGAAGMMAAIMAAKQHHDVILLEKNEKLGKKIYITGKGRCNITNSSDIDVIFKNVVTNSKFLYSSLYSFTNDDTIQFFEENGLRTKVERGNRVFPVSDHSSDVISTLDRCMRKLGVDIRLNTEVKDVLVNDEKVFTGVKLCNGSKLTADACIVATGGLSYPTTGSTGDGYRFAKEVGHNITPRYPSLVSIHLADYEASALQGLTLKNIEVKVDVKSLKKQEESDDTGKKKKNKLKVGKELYSAFGDMLFTHFGISGPVILSGTSMLLKYLNECEMEVHIDLKPALKAEQLDARILRDFGEIKNKQFKNSLEHLLPQKMIGTIIKLSGIPEEKQVNAITKEERQRLVESMKNLTFTIERFGGFNEAVITKGGIDVKEIDPTTMESKLAKGLYFAGEVLDLDALTGGYNLQIAWSTGAAAGQHVCEQKN